MYKLVEIKASEKRKFDELCASVMEKNQAAGIAAAFFDKDGNIIYENFYGYRDAEKKLPIDENTIFGLASITKSFVTLCILKLAYEGKISLDDPVSKYFPDFTGKNMKGILRLKHLLSHAGGFYPLRRTCVYDVAEKLGLNEEKDGDFATNLRLIEEGAKIVASQMDNITEHIGLPGEKMSYCNDGFGLLSDVVRMAGGEKTYSDYVRKNILEPLYMERTMCDFIKPALDENSSMLYKVEKGKRVCHHDYHDFSFVLNGAGVMKSTIENMIKYVRMYLNDGVSAEGRRIIPARCLEEMEKPRQVMNPDLYYCWGITVKRIEGLNMFGHSGGLPGVSSYFAFMPEAGIGGVVLCNTEGCASPSICEAGMRMALGKETKLTRYDYPEIKWDEDFVKDVCGKYISDETADSAGYEIVSEDGKLLMKAGDNLTELKPFSSHYALARKMFSDAFFKPLVNDEGRVYAARYGSTVFKKA